MKSCQTMGRRQEWYLSGICEFTEGSCRRVENDLLTTGFAHGRDPPQGGSLTKTDPNSKEIPAPYREMKEIMDRERGTAKQ